MLSTVQVLFAAGVLITTMAGCDCLVSSHLRSIEPSFNRISNTKSSFDVASSSYSNDDDEDVSGRFLFSNTTSVTVSIASLTAGLLTLVALALLAALVAYYLFGETSTYGTGYSDYSAHSSGYGSGRSAQTASPYSELFSSLSILDWISLAEELYRDFDTSSMDCQKRVICQLHQNEANWGATARRMNNAFSYVQYLELLNLPEEMRAMLDEYILAAEKGRSQTGATCAQTYPACRLNIVQLIEKYSHTD